MKFKWLLIGLLTVSGVCGARADLTVVQKINYVSGLPAEALGMVPQETTTRVKGGKMRVDTPPISYSVTDFASGDSFAVMESQKSYIKISGTALAGEVAKASADIDPAAKPVATGQTERVGDYDTEIYTMTLPQFKMRLWVAKNFPDYAQIKDEVKKLTFGPMLKMVGGKAPSAEDLPGMVVKTEMELTKPLPMTVQTTLVSVSRDAISDDIFVIPADYKETQMPRMPSLR